MKGKMVIVRTVENQFVVRRVWDIGDRVVYVTDEKNYALLINGKGGIIPIGAPKEDVFEYDEGAQLDLAKLRKFQNI